MQRPLHDREAFKAQANRLIVTGLGFLSLALILATELVLDEVIQIPWVPWVATGLVTLLLAIIWWIIPLRNKNQQSTPPSRTIH